MALLYIDGFESYGTVNATQTDLASKYSLVSGTGISVVPGRNGNGLSFDSSVARALRQIDTTNDTIIAGFAFYTNNLGSSTTYPFYFKNATSFGVGITVCTSDGSIGAIRNSTALGSSANTGVITVNTWHHIIIKTKCNNSTGTVEIWVDGVKELDLSGVDTLEGANPAYHNAFQLRRGLNSGNYIFDDLYICDASGSTNNDSLGDKVVYTIRPDGDDTTDWTANGGGNHYSEVDEAVFDGDDFITTNTTTDQDIFTYADLSGTGNIVGVQVTSDVKETAAGKSYQFKHIEKSTGNTVCSANIAVGTTDWDGRVTVFETDPDGDSWTQSAVNATKFGIEAV